MGNQIQFCELQDFDCCDLIVFSRFFGHLSHNATVGNGFQGALATVLHECRILGKYVIVDWSGQMAESLSLVLTENEILRFLKIMVQSTCSSDAWV